VYVHAYIVEDSQEYAKYKTSQIFSIQNMKLHIKNTCMVYWLIPCLSRPWVLSQWLLCYSDCGYSSMHLIQQTRREILPVSSMAWSLFGYWKIEKFYILRIL